MTLKVIDSHLHIWDPAVQDLPWLASLPALQHRYTVDDLAAHYARQGVEFLGGVYVEVDAADPLLEDRLIYENGSPLILKRMMRTRVSPYMRVLGPEFLDGLRVLASLHMPFELCNRGDELPDMARALAQVPEETVMIDHLGNMPGLDADSKRAIEALGELPNTYIKISGDNPVDPHIVEFVREAFGPKKVLYSSNWPVVELNSSFDAHFALMRDLFGSDEDFFMNNACRAYGIRI